MTPLAQISADQLGPLVPWLVGASAMLFLANQALTFWKEHMREKPIPGETYATLTQIKEVHGRIKRERDEINIALAKIEAAQAASAIRLDAELNAIREQLAANNEAGEERAAKLHDRINVMLESTSELRGEVRHALNAQSHRK
ncbi:MAG: hypothetical protein H7067_07680 [Burkholderiales bacterium]|nr:hypothetical protein [Opitutaceae bacterium]